MVNSDSLCKKNILLTGGGSGMGQATALSLAAHGANVLIAGRKIDALNSTISKSAVPDKITAKEADVTNRDSLNKLFTSFDQKFGELDNYLTLSITKKNEFPTFFIIFLKF